MKELPEKADVRSDPPKVDVLGIIQKSAHGGSILSFYEKKQHLDEETRSRLISLVLDFIFEAKMKLSRETMRDMAHQISEIFPNEDEA